MNFVRIAMAQMHVEGGAPERNLARAAARIREAAAAGAHFVVLPECLDLGWMHASAREQAEPIPGPITERLACEAREHSIHVVAGVTECSGEHLHNAAVLLSPTGELLLHHRKINELDIGRNLYTTGTRLATALTPFGPVGIPICADLLDESVVLGHALGQMGARLLLSPAAWAVEPEFDQAVTPYGGNWRRSYTAVARRWSLGVVGVSNVGRVDHGPWMGYRCIGHSLAVGRSGEVLAQAAFGDDADTLLVVDVAL